MTVDAPEKTQKIATRARKTRVAINHGLDEIYVASAAREARPKPTIVDRDNLAVERRPAGAFRGLVYFVWMEHDPDGGCDRNPDTDPHEDLAYVGKTCRPFATRQAEHLARFKPGTAGPDGTRLPNNSAVYRHRLKVTGWSLDPRGLAGRYDTADKLDAAEDYAIKKLWPAWNIQQQDRRNPHTRATRAHRKPDRLAPLIGVASVLWGLMWASVTCVLTGAAWAAPALGGLIWASLTNTPAGPAVPAPWWELLACPFVALYIVNGTALRHARRLTRHRRRS